MTPLWRIYVVLTYSPQTNKYNRMTVLNLTGNNCGRSDIMNQLYAENELMGLLCLFAWGVPLHPDTTVLVSMLIPKTFSHPGCKHLTECLSICGHIFISLDTFIAVLKAILACLGQVHIHAFQWWRQFEGQLGKLQLFVPLGVSRWLLAQCLFKLK